MGKGNHNGSYDTTGNNTIMSHLSVNVNGKTNSNPKKRKSDRTGKENNDVDILRLETKLLELLKKLKLLV